VVASRQTCGVSAEADDLANALIQCTPPHCVCKLLEGQNSTTTQQLIKSCYIPTTMQPLQLVIFEEEMTRMKSLLSSSSTRGEEDEDDNEEITD